MAWRVWERGQNSSCEVYQVEVCLRDQEAQVLIPVLSQIGCKSFNFSVFVCFSTKKVVPSNGIHSRSKMCPTLGSRIVSSNCFIHVLPKRILKRYVPPHF